MRVGRSGDHSSAYIAHRGATAEHDYSGGENVHHAHMQLLKILYEF